MSTPTGVDVTVGGDPVIFQASVPFEIAVPRIGFVVSPVSPEEALIWARRVDEWFEAIVQQALQLRGANMERTMAALDELQQALADLSGQPENDEATAAERMQQLVELQEQFAELLVVCPLNKLTLDLRGVSTVRAEIGVRRPVWPHASNRKVISGTYH